MSLSSANYFQQTGLEICGPHNVTVYLDPGKCKTNYTLTGCSYTTAYLSEGSHEFFKQCSVHNINVLSKS